MTIETFSRQQFEAALPDGFWNYAGFVQNEHAYNIPVTDDIFIQIRSSVKSNGFSADVSKDSIRMWLTDGNGKPLGSKVSNWTTREPGWRIRLLEKLRLTWKMAKFAGYCDDCHVPHGVFKVKKAGKNKGRIFRKCRICGNNWKWMDE